MAIKPLKLETQEKYLIMKTTTKKNYDCVQAVRRERERIAKETEGKSPKEILAYFKRKKKENTIKL